MTNRPATRDESGDSTEEPGVSAHRAIGFQAYLEHANLHNLLQAESLGRSSGVFVVRSSAGIGFLHLLDGVLIHAECGQVEGEAAALEILSWAEGTFESCNHELEPMPTVSVPVQALLMRLAKKADDMAHSQTQTGTRLAYFPKADVNTANAEDDTPPATSRSRATPPPLPPSMRSGEEGAEPLVSHVQLSSEGQVLRGRGASLEAFAGRVAYAARLAELVGRSLRSGSPTTLELVGRTTLTTVRLTEDGRIVGQVRRTERVEL
jgi:hypothetical protein